LILYYLTEDERRINGEWMKKQWKIKDTWVPFWN